MAQEEINAKSKSRPKPMSETRKIRKPLMERKRRERINTSLNELARLLTEVQKVKTEGGKAAKLEKADILELTVRHLQSLHSNQDTRTAHITEDDKFQEGFGECIRVVEKALKKSTTEELKERLLTHLYGRLKALRASHRRRQAEEKQEEKENRLSDAEEDSALKNCATEGKQSSSEKCSFTLVPTDLPDGGVAFVLTGNPQRLFKEWENLSVEASLATQKINNSENENTASGTTNALGEFANSPPALLSGQITKSTQTHRCSFPKTQQHSIAIRPSTSSIANPTLHFERDYKSCHTLQPLNSRLSYSLPTGNPSRPRPQTKAHCPPTPPPSPQNNEEGRKASPTEAPHQPPGGKDGDIIQEMEVEQEQEQDMNEPFDLSVSRMWRPW